jgi:hypothetical protein
MFFVKFATVVPLQGKSGDAAAMGIIQSIKEMGRKPKIVYTDGETGFDSYALRDYFVEQNIKHYITRTHANVAERFIRTYKALLYQRIDSVKNTALKDPQWPAYNFQVLLTCNKKLIHSSTTMTPADARKTANQVDVKSNLELCAKKNRTYPPLSINDTVNIKRKKQPNEEERQSFWSEDSYKVSAVTEQFGQKYYKVSDQDHRDYIRGELLKV